MSREETVSARYIPKKIYIASTGRLLIEDSIAYKKTAIELEGSGELAQINESHLMMVSVLHTKRNENPHTLQDKQVGLHPSLCFPP